MWRSFSNAQKFWIIMGYNFLTGLTLLLSCTNFFSAANDESQVLIAAFSFVCYVVGIIFALFSIIDGINEFNKWINKQ